MGRAVPVFGMVHHPTIEVGEPILPALPDLGVFVDDRVLVDREWKEKIGMEVENLSAQQPLW